MPLTINTNVFITCAITGSGSTQDRSAEVPRSPEQIANSAIAAAKAGAAVVHCHVRDPETGAGSRDPDLFLDMATRVRNNGVKALMNITCGGGAIYCADPTDESRAGPGSDMASAEERYKHIEMCMPEVCSLDMTTQNQLDGDKAYVYLNTEYTLRKWLSVFKSSASNLKLKCLPPAIFYWPIKC